MSDEKTLSAESLTGKDNMAIFNEVSNELLGIETPVEETDAEKLPVEPAAEEVAKDTIEPESKEEVEEDADDVILDDLLAEEEGEETPVEDTNDETTESEVTDSIRKLKINGEEIEVNADDAFAFYQKNQGREDSFTKKEMELSEKTRVQDQREATLDWLQYQGEFAPKFHAYKTKESALNEAKQALAKGEAYKGIVGDELVKQITSAQIVVDNEKNQLDSEYRTKMQSMEIPGRKELEERIPDLPKTYGKYTEEVWKPVAKEFGFTDVELNSNSDFRYWGLLNEITGLRDKVAKHDAIMDKARKRRDANKGKAPTKGSPKTAAAGPSKSPAKKAEANSIVYDNNLSEKLAKGDLNTRASVINDLFSK